jgi:hypothetical protein
MKVKLDGGWVCSICGSVWEPLVEHGGSCAFCGADSKMEDLPFDEGMICEEDDDAEVTA